MLFLLQNGTVGPSRESLGYSLSRHRNRTPDKLDKTPRGTIFKYKRALLTICMVYWNDFVCGGYRPPDVCSEYNAAHWHFPEECLDLNGNFVPWP